MSTDTFPAIPRVTGRESPPPPPPPRRGRFWRRAFLVVLVAAVVAVFGAIGYLKWTEGKIDRIPSSELTALQQPTGDTDMLNFLVVATDDRSNLPDDWEDNFGEFAGRRADVIMLAHLIPGERIQLLSIPRDLKASIPGAGTNRINAAYVVGGPDLLIEVVQAETGIPVHHYVEIDFGGFAAVVDALGGVSMDFPRAARDPKSGFAVDAGTHQLDGEMAVAYSRSRGMQVLEDGSWQGQGGGDIARTQRQQEILVRLFDQVTSPSSAFNLPGFLPTFAEQITADESLSLGVMADVARAALGLRSGNIERATLPVRNTKGDDGRAYVEPVAEADAVLRAFLFGDPYPPAE
jgi:LCP family protein required for cell wall assembly